MHLSPTAAFIIHVALNTAIFTVLYLVVRKAIVSQTKAKVLGTILKKCREIEKQIQSEKDAKDPGEWGHYARIRNEKRAYAIECLSEAACDISKS